jgi:hypothetical protein
MDFAACLDVNQILKSNQDYISRTMWNSKQKSTKV